MIEACNICGERPRTKNQGTCSQCRWEKHGAKAKVQLKTPEARQRIRHWKRTRSISDASKEREIRRSKRYANRYPEREKAKRKLNWEITMGRMVRPETCTVCGKSDRRRDGRSLIQAHHDDYSLPLDVKWFRIQCHTNHHRALKDGP